MNIPIEDRLSHPGPDFPTRGARFVWRAPDGDDFPCIKWEPSGLRKGVMICLHGLSGAATDFESLAAALNREGISCFALNLRGQGNDPNRRRRGAELNLLTIAGHVSAFTRDVLGEHHSEGFWVCGESMGALISAWMIANSQWTIPPRGAIFSVPVVELGRRPPSIIRNAVRFLSAAAPRLRFYPSWFVSGKVGPLKVTRDEDYWLQIQASPHHLKAFTFRFLNELGNLMEMSIQSAERVNVPSLVLAAGRDVYLRPHQIEAWFQHLKARDKTLKIYPDAYHLLWNDFDRGQVIADVLAWLRQRGAFNT